jgi:hypothetical protein
MIVTRHIERHRFLADAAEIELSVQRAGVVVHWTGQIPAVGPDDRAATAQNELIR